MDASDAAHQFGALNTLLFVVILGLCILAAYLIKVNSFYYLPESAAAILLGLVVGGLARVVYPSVEELEFLSFQSELFFFLLLPPIIFEAAYSFDKKDFFSNIWTISLFAVFGTIISTFLIGYMVYGFGLLHFIRIDTSSPMEALMFGALISSIDPVATLGIMGNTELNCDTLLYSLVFGESVLNDAVAIVLFKTFSSFYESGKLFNSQSLGVVMLNFFTVSIFSLLCGVIIGLICCYICKNTKLKNYPEYEISLLLLFAYGSYAFCESINLSGIMSLFFCGVILSHYNSYNLSSTSQVTAHNIFKAFAVLCDFFVYLFIGMGIFTGKFKHWNLTFSIFCIFTCILTRFFNIFPLSFIANLFRKQRIIPWNMQCMMWFSGLRGAISFALSMQIPGEHKDIFVSATLSTVIFTTVILGGCTEPMLNYLRLKSALLNSSSSSIHKLDIDPIHGINTNYGNTENKQNNIMTNIATTSSLSAIVISSGDSCKGGSTSSRFQPSYIRYDLASTKDDDLLLHHNNDDYNYEEEEDHKSTHPLDDIHLHLHEHHPLHMNQTRERRISCDTTTSDHNNSAASCHSSTLNTHNTHNSHNHTHSHTVNTHHPTFNRTTIHTLEPLTIEETCTTDSDVLLQTPEKTISFLSQIEQYYMIPLFGGPSYPSPTRHGHGTTRGSPVRYMKSP